LTAFISKIPRSATALKLFAVVLMFIDHIHQMWAYQGAPVWLNCLGRPVFPIFLFLMAETFHHTKNRKKLLLRLFCGSLFMYVFNIALGIVYLPNDNILLSNNAFAAFFVVIFYMYLCDMLTAAIKEGNIIRTLGSLMLCFVPLLSAIPIIYIYSIDHLPLWAKTASLIIPNALFVEGGPAFVALGIAFYVLRDRRYAQIAALAVISAWYFILNPSSIQWMMVFAAVPIALYNGEKGRGIKRFFYIFYPAHIYILYIISTVIFNNQNT